MVPGNFTLKPGEQFTMPWEAGKVGKVTFYCDHTYVDEAQGIKAEPPQKLRIAIRDAAGKAVGSTLHIEVGDSVSGTTGSKSVTLAKNATVAYITREDTGTKNIGFLMV